MYKRSDVYPDGSKIPESLPDSYQAASNGNSPARQYCVNCKHYNVTTRYCDAYKATAKPKWWCASWEQTSDSFIVSPQLMKKITTNTVEEHFAESPKKVTQANNYSPKNEEDVIQLNVPLMIRLLEWARETANIDVDLHEAAEVLTALSSTGELLNMENYSEIIDQEESND